MAGSQQGNGFFNVSGSGPDVYVFKPQRRIGGYAAGFLGLGGRVSGEFIAYGRPMLEKEKPAPVTSPTELAVQ